MLGQLDWTPAFKCNVSVSAWQSNYVLSTAQVIPMTGPDDIHGPCALHCNHLNCISDDTKPFKHLRPV